MRKPFLVSLCAVIAVFSALPLRAQTSPTDSAVEEAVRRQANTIVLRQRLVEAHAAVQKKDYGLAAKLYEDAYTLCDHIGSGVEGELVQTVNGLAASRLELAKRARQRHDYKEANVQLSRVVKVAPGNEEAVELKKQNDHDLALQAGHIPSDEALAMVSAIQTNQLNAATLVQDGKLLFELGRYDDAQKKIDQALELDPNNQGGRYYKNLILNQRSRVASHIRSDYAKERQLDIQQAWEPTISRDQLPTPNPYARTNLIHTGRGRQIIASKLDRIRLDTVMYDGLPLGEVIRLLNEESKKRDPDKRGINFLINPNEGAQSAFLGVPSAIDPTTGLPIQSAPQLDEEVDLAGVLIKITPPLTDVRMADVLDAIVKTAEQPIKFSIEDYAIVFSSRGPEIQPLYTRTWKVDPNTFYQGLQSVGGMPFGDVEVGSTGTGGGTSGGGGGGGQTGTGSSGIAVPRVNVAGQLQTGGGRGGGGGGLQGGGLQGGGSGLRFITSTNNMEEVQSIVRQFFITMGVDLTPPKTIFFNDRSGTLWARATMQELDIIESAVQVLNVAPPQVNIKAKFADIGQEDKKALGFDWWLGNFLIGDGAAVGSGGTQPSLVGEPSTANPLGFFPGTSLANTTPSQASDQNLTSGLGNPLNAPTVATFTGILTDPQFRVAIKALEQRQGVELLSAPEVTTLSGRQAQIQIIDIQSIVTGIDLSQNQGGGGGVGGGITGGGVAAIGSTLNYNVQALPFGPVLDVVPYVAADGYTVQLVVIPTVTEFIGYDDPGQFVPQAQSVSGGQGAAIPIEGQLPLPRFRLRQVVTSAIVWDGQTVVLGGLMSEGVEKTKDKVPLLGDLPLVGRLFRSESSDTKKRNLVIFITPTIIDPAGNRLHSEDEMPFANSIIPDQEPFAAAEVN